jgi:phosphate transport system protein
LLRDLENLKKRLLDVGHLVEQAIRKSTLALLDRRTDLAQEAIDGDEQIDMAEVHVEEECLKILALHQPVATDLRFLIAVLKANNDLERMGDLAESIARRAHFLASHEALRIPSQFEMLVDKTYSLVQQSLNALIELDTRTARAVLREDAEIDELNRQMFVELQELMKRQPATVERAVSLLSASRQLERIADHATNLAEDVIFLVEGQIVRHRRRT